jgi:hypothetical protein
MVGFSGLDLNHIQVLEEQLYSKQVSNSSHELAVN